MNISISDLRLEAYNAIKNYIDFNEFILDFSESYSSDWKEVTWFLLANKFDEQATFYEVNEFCNVRKLDPTFNNNIKSYLMGVYNGGISPIKIPDDNIIKHPLEGVNPTEKLDNNKEFDCRNICVNIDELRELPYLQGKINFDDLILDFTDYNSDIPQPPINPHDIKARLSKEQAENYRLSQENAKLKAQIASLTDNHSQPQTGEPITPANGKELPTRTANNASMIISALASELLGMDLTKPHADDTNGKIQRAIEKQRNKLGKDTIAYWLKSAHEISK